MFSCGDGMGKKCKNFPGGEATSKKVPVGQIRGLTGKGICSGNGPTHTSDKPLSKSLKIRRKSLVRKGWNLKMASLEHCQKPAALEQESGRAAESRRQGEQLSRRTVEQVKEYHLLSAGRGSRRYLQMPKREMNRIAL